MRRFLIKARFGYLTAAQAAAAFSKFFGIEAPSEIKFLENLTPADFALVRRRAALLGSLPKPKTLITLLSSESDGRNGGRRIGFAA
jgi:hypothetical protein